MAIAIGDAVPPLKVTDQSGNQFDMTSLRGKTVVLYFYPKADTPGCTTESCEYRDHASDFAKKNAVIVGISPDTGNAQAKFQSKYELPFTLIADADHAVAEVFGVWKEKSMYGKKYMGVERTTFVIGPDGRVRRIFEKVKPAGHAAEVLAAL